FELVCVTDFENGFDDSIITYPFVYEERGWISLMEMFNPEIVKDKAILLGLDTIIVNDLEPIEKASGLIAPLDPYNKVCICNAVVAVDHETSSIIWDTWTSGYDSFRDDSEYFMNGIFSEMFWMRKNLKPDLWDDLLPGRILSYKAHIKGREKLPDDCVIVYFHGNPKQTEINEPWLKEITGHDI
ncbi:MAG: hypothetical protein QF704_09170, partial [Anaerolineales bacterium]|nr:hypothetical protein [Anaerolineales bacterium]